MLESILIKSAVNISYVNVLICCGVSIFLGLLIAFIHKLTSSYSKNFLVTVSILPLLVQIVILLVNGNLGMSIAVAGTFSLVRFRSIPGTSKEILAVFFASTVGLCTGMGYIYLALIITGVGSLLMLLLDRIRLFDRNRYEKVLHITIPEDLDYTEVFTDILEKYTRNYSLEKVKTTNLGSMFDLTYNVELFESTNEKEFIDELRVRNGNLKIILTHELSSTDL